MLRNCVSAFCVASLVLASVAVASAGYFTDLGAMAPLNNYNAIPDGINSGGAVSMQGYSSAYHANNQYYHVYLYTGGTAPTLSDITSAFTNITSGNAMNGSGQMAVEGVGSGYGYLYSGGTVTSYKYSGTYSTVSTAINANGDVGGYYINTAGGSITMTPMVYSGGTAYGLNVPAGDTTYGADILALNTSGQAVGGTDPASGAAPPGLQAAVWTYTISGGSVASQTATDIGSLVRAQYPSAQTSALLAINSSGIAVGSWTTTYTSSLILSGLSGSFIYNVATQGFTSLGSLLVGSPFPGSLSHEAGQSQAVNDSGMVVGCIVNTANSSGYDAAIWRNGVITDLNTLYAPVLPAGFVLDNATAIDNSGDIAGYGHDASGNNVQAFSLQALLPGDANEDGKVDVNDLTKVLTSYNQTVGMDWTTGDFNNDSKVDINDLTIVLSHYNQTAGASGLSAVPEPSVWSCSASVPSASSASFGGGSTGHKTRCRISQQYEQGHQQGWPTSLSHNLNRISGLARNHRLTER